MTHEPIDYALAVGILAMPFVLTIGISAAIAKHIARREFVRMFKGVVMVRGKGGKFTRL